MNDKCLIQLQEAQLLPGWPTVLPHSRRSMEKLWCIHANRSSRFLVMLLTKNSIAVSPGLPEMTQNVIRSSHGHSTPSLKISWKSVQSFSRNVADKEISASRGLSELTQNVMRSSHGYSTPSLKISCKSVQPFRQNTKRHRRQTERWHTVPKARPIVRSAKKPYYVFKKWTHCITWPLIQLIMCKVSCIKSKHHWQ